MQDVTVRPRGFYLSPEADGGIACYFGEDWAARDGQLAIICSVNGQWGLLVEKGLVGDVYLPPLTAAACAMRGGRGQQIGNQPVRLGLP